MRSETRARLILAEFAETGAVGAEILCDYFITSSLCALRVPSRPSREYSATGALTGNRRGPASVFACAREAARELSLENDRLHVTDTTMCFVRTQRSISDTRLFYDRLCALCENRIDALVCARLRAARDNYFILASMSFIFTGAAFAGNFAPPLKASSMAARSSGVTATVIGCLSIPITDLTGVVSL